MSVIVSHVAFGVAAALIQVSQVQFDPLASIADVRVSHVQFDPAKVVGGRIPRSWPTKKVLITVDGTRYLVPWDKIDSFLSLAQDDVVKKATIVAKKATKKRAPPKIIIKEAPPEIRAAVQLAVDRTNEQIRTLWYRALEIALRERDDEEALLLLA